MSPYPPLHRLALWLEARGHLYYLLHKKSSGSAAGAFVAMQRAIEPQSKHVEQVRHVEHRVEEDEATGLGEFPGREPLSSCDHDFIDQDEMSNNDPRHLRCSKCGEDRFG